MSSSEGCTLEVFKVGVQACITQKMAGKLANWEVVAERVGQTAVMSLIGYVAGERLDIIEYPADWWQAWKARWCPRWARKRWPVRLTRIEATVYYPRLSLPHEDHTVRFVPTEAS